MVGGEALDRGAAYERLVAAHEVLGRATLSVGRPEVSDESRAALVSTCLEALLELCDAGQVWLLERPRDGRKVCSARHLTRGGSALGECELAVDGQLAAIEDALSTGGLVELWTRDTTWPLATPCCREMYLALPSESAVRTLLIQVAESESTQDPSPRRAELIGLVGHIAALFAQVDSQLELRAQREIFEALWNDGEAGAVTVGAKGEALRINDRAAKLVGRAPEELKHLRVDDWLPGTCIATSPEHWQGQVRDQHGDSRACEIRVTPMAEGRLIQLWDREETANLQRELASLQRSRLLGTLSNGVVHDLNNLITVIYAALDSIEAGRGGTHISDIVGDAQEAVRRCENLCRQLSMLHRRRPGAIEVLHPDTNIIACKQLLSRILPDDVNFVLTLQAPEARLRLSQGAVEQILLNLLLQVRTVLPGFEDSASSRVEIRTSVQDGRLLLELIAEGLGPESTRDSSDEGRGMRVVESLLSGIDSSLRRESFPGGRVAYSLSVALDDTPMIQGVSRSFRRQLARGKTALVCENEPVLREVIGRLLTQEGFDVVTSENGQDAVQGQKAIDLLITDLVMPNLGGAKVADHWNTAGKSTPTVFISGLAEAPEVDGIEAPTTFLRKPFRIEELLDAVGAVLR